MESTNVIYDVIATIEVVIDQMSNMIPAERKEKLKKEIKMLKELLVDKRSPRLMIIGRRGAGKSSLINAIFCERVADTGAVLSKTGRSQYYAYQSSRGKLDILDTRGLGDRTKPETANFQNAIDDIKASIETDYPDAILFLCRAKDVDSNIDVDIKNVLEIHSHIANKHKFNAPVVGVITSVDELDPKRIEPPYDDQRKRTNIDTAVKAVENALVSAGLDLIKVIPTSAYAEYDEVDKNKVAYQNYWNIDALLTYLIDVLPNSTHLELARLAKIRSLQVTLARTIMGATATITGAIAVVPIPLADIIPITTAQVGMIIGIAYISGRELSQKSAMEFIAALGINVGTGVVLREAARALVKYVFPGGGLVVSAAVASAGTIALGESAIRYFIEGKSIEEAKETFSLVKAKQLEKQ
jgi:uncharacterized protein (DUF697 family)/GTPase Era involved in 16S rRNA processing